MKTKILPSLAILLGAGLLISQNPSAEKAPKGAEEKIRQALPAAAPAKPASPRKLLIFSVTNGIHRNWKTSSHRNGQTHRCL
jgi:hypothetical protein